MTRYHGGKIRTGKFISDTMKKYLKDTDRKIDGYIEPFCGMCGVYRQFVIDNEMETFVANDVDEKIINFWTSLQNGWIPPDTIDHTTFLELKKNKNQINPLNTFIGHACTFGAQYFNTFTTNNNILHSKNKCIDDVKRLKNVNFTNKDYREYSHLNNFVIYCDPPYTKGHKFNKFDNKEFWNWCLKMARNNIVFVSEQYCPINHIELLSTKHLGSRFKNNGATSTEKLFLVN